MDLFSSHLVHLWAPRKAQRVFPPTCLAIVQNHDRHLNCVDNMSANEETNSCSSRCVFVQKALVDRKGGGSDSQLLFLVSSARYWANRLLSWPAFIIQARSCVSCQNALRAPASVWLSWSKIRSTPHHPQSTWCSTVRWPFQLNRCTPAYLIWTSSLGCLSPSSPPGFSQTWKSSD